MAFNKFQSYTLSNIGIVMKILMVHNDYGKYSGEEAVVDRFIADGRRAGYEIETLRRTSKFARENIIGQIKGFFSGVYSFEGVRMMKEAIHSFKPDIVHIHNLYPFISPAALFACKKAGIPVVMTVHNYRLMCPTGLFLREGHPCENCLINGNEKDCIRFNCEGSRFRTLGYALRNYASRKSGAYKKCVDYFCCLTEFQKQKLVEAGFDKEKIFVFYNYIQIPIFDESEQSDRPEDSTSYVGFVGRLSEEKGYDLLLEVAERHPEINFQFAGHIREDAKLKELPNVLYRGLLNEQQLYRFYEDAKFIAMPSRYYEGFPIVLLEAMSHGKPCVVPNHGCFPELVEYNNQLSGSIFSPMDVDSLEHSILELWNNEDKVSALGKNARKNFDARFSKRKINQEWDAFLHQIVNEVTSKNSTQTK